MRGVGSRSWLGPCVGTRLGIGVCGGGESRNGWRAVSEVNGQDLTDMN